MTPEALKHADDIVKALYGAKVGAKPVDQTDLSRGFRISARWSHLACGHFVCVDGWSPTPTVSGWKKNGLGHWQWVHQEDPEWVTAKWFSRQWEQYDRPCLAYEVGRELRLSLGRAIAREAVRELARRSRRVEAGE